MPSLENTGGGTLTIMSSICHNLVLAGGFIGPLEIPRLIAFQESQTLTALGGHTPMLAAQELEPGLVIILLICKIARVLQRKSS